MTWLDSGSCPLSVLKGFVRFIGSFKAVLDCSPELRHIQPSWNRHALFANGILFGDGPSSLFLLSFLKATICDDSDFKSLTMLWTLAPCSIPLEEWNTPRNISQDRSYSYRIVQRRAVGNAKDIPATGQPTNNT